MDDAGIVAALDPHHRIGEADGYAVLGGMAGNLRLIAPSLRPRRQGTGGAEGF